MQIERYTPSMAHEWNLAVQASRNGTFLHLREYMDYHADRFADCSLLARDDRGRILAVLPAAVPSSGDANPCSEVCSHSGLTFGGWLMTPRADANAMMEIWQLMTQYYKAQGFTSIFYRPVPHIYHRYPAEEDLYALWRAGGVLVSVLLSSVIDLSSPLGFDMSFRQDVRKAAAKGVTVEQSDDFEGFWHVLTECLAERHEASPVHTLDEIRLLHSRFPEQIRLYTACDAEGCLVGGVVVYGQRPCLHSQYTATTAAGRALRVLPAIYQRIITDASSAGVRYLDLGTSNEEGGRVLNSGLVRQKCSMGARAIAYPAYKIQL